MSNPSCSFCGKPSTEVKVLIAGPIAFICNECVAMCVDILIDRTIPSNLRKMPVIDLVNEAGEGI